ncbi:MAG: hypothetical protein E7505_07410 [Ruminococcus sp.]|nr:hypothetical protein [Ruminococcus sp.]
MNFFAMGTVHNFSKQFEIQKKWEVKKKTGNFDFDPDKKHINDWFENERENNSDKTLKSITAKIEKGEELSSYEKQYLKANNPDLYRKVLHSEYEKKSFEKELEQCRTKEEVENVKFAHTAASFSALKSVQSDPNIPESAKLQFSLEELGKLKCREHIFAKFVKSGKYDELPTEAEKLEAEKLIAEEEKTVAVPEASENIIGEETVSQKKDSDIADTETEKLSEAEEKEKIKKYKNSQKKHDDDKQEVTDTVRAAYNFFADAKITANTGENYHKSV